MRKSSFLERYGAVAKSLRQLKEAADEVEENGVAAGGRGDVIDGSRSTATFQGSGGRVVSSLCADAEKCTNEGLLTFPKDLYLLRARACIFRCKSRLDLYSEEGNNDALALADLRQALVISKGHSLVTALEICDAVHEAAWRYESDLSTGPDDTPHSYLSAGQSGVCACLRDSRRLSPQM